MKRKLIVCLSALLVCLSFVSCGDDDEKPKNTDTSQSEEVTVPTAAKEELEVPLTADYNQYEFKVLTSGSGGNYNDFMYEEEPALALDKAQYKRKLTVESNYNIQITETAISSGNTSGSGKGFMELSLAANSGDFIYDLALIGGYDVSTAAYNGYLYDMNSVPGIDLTKSWWDQNAVESLSVKDIVFFTAGELSQSRADAAFCIMFNKKIAADYSIENPYDMVKNKTWTIENFAELCKTVTEDLNQDDSMDENDRYGLLVLNDSLLGMVNAAGERCAVVNDSGEIELTLYTERTLSAIEQYLNIAYNKDYALMYQRHGSGRTFEDTLWNGEHGLFWTTYMKMIPRYREMESDFGILPYPMLDKEQDGYHSTIFPFISQFVCIPLNQEDIERTGVITEALAYHGQKIVRPAYYDVTLVGQSTRDEESVEMLDIIFDSLVYDIGYIYQIGTYNKQLIYMISNDETNFSSRYEANKQAAETLLTKVNEAYAMAVNEWKQ